MGKAVRLVAELRGRIGTRDDMTNVLTGLADIGIWIFIIAMAFSTFVVLWAFVLHALECHREQLRIDRAIDDFIARTLGPASTDSRRLEHEHWKHT